MSLLYPLKIGAELGQSAGKAVKLLPLNGTYAMHDDHLRCILSQYAESICKNGPFAFETSPIDVDSCHRRSSRLSTLIEQAFVKGIDSTSLLPLSDTGLPFQSLMQHHEVCAILVVSHHLKHDKTRVDLSSSYAPIPRIVCQGSLQWKTVRLDRAGFGSEEDLFCLDLDDLCVLGLRYAQGCLIRQL